MSALRLFDLQPLPSPPDPEPVLRAICPHCKDFSVLPETRACSLCGRPLDRRYDFVEYDEEDEPCQ